MVSENKEIITKQYVREMSKSIDRKQCAFREFFVMTDDASLCLK